MAQNASVSTTPLPPRIVLVDDDRDLLRALTFAFEIDGFEVCAYQTAEAARAQYRKGNACFVVDQRLPGMSGLDFIEHLRAARETAPSILITTHPDVVTKSRARTIGAVIIEKPLLKDVLTDEVRRLIIS